MRAVLGIGNIGNRYAFTRHNAGFMFLDFLAGKFSLEFIPSKSEYYYCKGKFKGAEFLLIRPVTYVNNSGIAAAHFISAYNSNPEDLLVIHDEINLPFGKIKTKISGGDGGHNGVSSLIYHLNSTQFPRIRIGIGGDFRKGEQVDYVLERFPDEQLETLGGLFEQNMPLVEGFIFNGVKGLLDANSMANPKEKKKENDQIDEN